MKRPLFAYARASSMAQQGDYDGPWLGEKIVNGDDVESIFASVPLFSELTPSQVREMVRACDPCHFEPGDILFEQGDKAEALFIVIRGELDVVVMSPSGEK